MFGGENVSPGPAVALDGPRLQRFADYITTNSHAKLYVIFNVVFSLTRYEG